MHSMYSYGDGFASGGRDGKVVLWHKDFQPSSTLDLAHTAKGYKGRVGYNALCIVVDSLVLHIQDCV